jgi:hypothetical protein
LARNMRSTTHSPSRALSAVNLDRATPSASIPRRNQPGDGSCWLTRHRRLYHCLRRQAVGASPYGLAWYPGNIRSDTSRGLGASLCRDGGFAPNWALKVVGASQRGPAGLVESAGLSEIAGAHSNWMRDRVGTNTAS